MPRENLTNKTPKEIITLCLHGLPESIFQPQIKNKLKSEEKETIFHFFPSIEKKKKKSGGGNNKKCEKKSIFVVLIS